MTTPFTLATPHKCPTGYMSGEVPLCGAAELDTWDSPVGPKRPHLPQAMVVDKGGEVAVAGERYHICTALRLPYQLPPETGRGYRLHGTPRLGMVRRSSPSNNDFSSTAPDDGPTYTFSYADLQGGHMRVGRQVPGAHGVPHTLSLSLGRLVLPEEVPTVP